MNILKTLKIKFKAAGLEVVVVMVWCCEEERWRKEKSKGRLWKKGKKGVECLLELNLKTTLIIYLCILSTRLKKYNPSPY